MNDLDKGAWADLDRCVGQLFLVGWDGDEVTPQIRSLIEDYHVGSVILTAKNLKSAHDTAVLVQELQTIAHKAGHPVPLLIALDQENGGVNSLYDEDYICQFPSAMGIAATNSLDLAFNVAKATAVELSAVGINMILGPVLDVLTNARYQPLGVRASGDDAQEVAQYGVAALKGYKEAGLTTCAKHWPSYGDLNFLGSNLDMPIITETMDQLKLSAFVPFQKAIQEGIHSIMTGGCAITNSEVNCMHACLSADVVDSLLRKDLGFDGVVISECLEMEALSNDIGVRQGTIMANLAGCDLLLLCKTYSVQLEAIEGLKAGIDNDMVTRERLQTSLRRMLRLKSDASSWQVALNPPGLGLLTQLHPLHEKLSADAYNKSITLMRDNNQCLPLSKMDPSEELLLLTPLLKPLPASAASKYLSDTTPLDRSRKSSLHSLAHEREELGLLKRSKSLVEPSMDRGSIMSGEAVFRELGKALARERNGKLLHTSYTANGVRPFHENLIERASAVIIVSADSNRNLYQAGFTKYVNMMCLMWKKPLIVVACSSPYDFAMDSTIGTYLCTYDFTEAAMAALVRVLFGQCSPRGSLPGRYRQSLKVQARTRQHWLVERYSATKDASGLDALLEAVRRSSSPDEPCPLLNTTASSFELLNPDIIEAHYMVRNSSTKSLYGFSSTYVRDSTAHLGAIFVEPSKRNMSIGTSLYQQAMKNISKLGNNITEVKLGIGLPNIYAGVMNTTEAEKSVRTWFERLGWPPSSRESRYTHKMMIRQLQDWVAPDELVQSVQRVPYTFDLLHGAEQLETLRDHLIRNSTWETLEIYRMALNEPQTCGVIRARSKSDGSIGGTVILCRHGANLTRYIPTPSLEEGFTGGILAPIIDSKASEQTKILQGLLLLGIRQNKAHKSEISYLSSINAKWLQAAKPLGFETMHTFEEIHASPSILFQH